jgi:hypothetical protein
MKTTDLLINVSYTDDTQKFWCESGIKNKIFAYDHNKNIHDFIANAQTFKGDKAKELKAELKALVK